MDLTTLLDVTIGPPGREDAEGAAKLDSVLDACSPTQRNALLTALDCDQDALLASRGRAQAYLGPPLIMAAIRWLCSRQTEWTSDLALHALAACRQRRSYEPLGGVATLTEMARSGVSFPAGVVREREFAALIDAFGDRGDGGAIRQAAHQLFGRMYVPRPVSSHEALADEPFQLYLRRLIAGPHDLATLREHVRRRHPDWYAPCSGQTVQPHILMTLRPRLHSVTMLRLPAGGTMGRAGEMVELAHWHWAYAFKNPDLIPIDQPWVARYAEAYRRWEAAYGDARWIEHLTPSLPPSFPPALAKLFGTATAVKPSTRWTKKLKEVVAGREIESRAGVLAMLRRLGSAEEVRASEAAWREPACTRTCTSTIAISVVGGTNRRRRACRTFCICRGSGNAPRHAERKHGHPASRSICPARSSSPVAAQSQAWAYPASGAGAPPRSFGRST